MITNDAMITNAVIAAALALIGFVITQSILRFVIEPIQEQRRLTGEVAQALVVYANVYINAPRDVVAKERAYARQLERTEEATKELRTLAGRLQSSLWAIPGYRALAFFNVVHGPANVLEASKELICLSNSLVGKNADKTIEKCQQIISEELCINRKLEKLEKSRRLRWR